MRILQKVIFAVLLIFSIPALQGEIVLRSLDEIAAYGSENNLDYRSSRVNVLQAEENLQGFFLLENSSISATGSYSDANSATWGVSSTLNMPIIEQFSLSGTIDQDLSGNISLSLSPLAHSDSREQSEISYDSSLILAESSRISAENGVISAALNWMTALREYETQQSQTELSATEYRDDKFRFDLGEISFDALQDSLISWSEDRVVLSEKEKSFRDSESALYSELGAGKDEVSIGSLTVDELKESLDALVELLDPEEGDYLKSSDLKLSVLNRLSSEAALNNTWIYEPDLRAGATLGFDDQGISSISASVTLSFSLDQIQNREKEISKEQYAIASIREFQERSEAELEFNQIIDTIESSSLNRDIAYIEFEQAEILLSEAELLFDRGDISQLDLEASRNFLHSSENALFKALADEYKAWIALKEYL